MPLSDIIKDQQARQAAPEGTAPAGQNTAAPSGETPDANKLLMGAAKSLTFGKIGDERPKGVKMGGRILTEPFPVQSTDFTTGLPKWWDNAARAVVFENGPGRKVMWDVVVPLDCGDTIPDYLREGEDDDGERRLFLNGHKREAVKQAVKEAGRAGLAVGGELYIAWVDSTPSKNPQFQDKKLYKAWYGPPPAVEVTIGDSPEDEAA